ncbi:MAG: hypothetical protein ABW252_22205 [Polyangiales bacterium]
MDSIPRKTSSAGTRAAFILACSAQLGCSDVASAGRLELSITEAKLVVGTGCEPACDPAMLSISVRYSSEAHPSIETIELLQYRIDYALDPAIGAVPFYADKVAVELKPGETKTLTLAAAGALQRTFVARALGGRAAAGQATITFAGYDWEDSQVLASSAFGIRFESNSEQTSDAGTSGRDGGTSE